MTCKWKDFNFIACEKVIKVAVTEKVRLKHNRQQSDFSPGLFCANRQLLSLGNLNISKSCKRVKLRLLFVTFCQLNYCYNDLKLGLLIFLAILKLLKILGFNLKMSILIFTLNRCWSNLSGFLLVFFFFIFSFVQLFYFMLYNKMADFRSINTAFFTCFSMMLNKFNFSELWVMGSSTSGQLI